ncbi:MAG: twin-arginine translocation signal domain-containing protein [Sedimentisphaerales bacterium]|nr:twin-arginine translocation signal domain-containing protein [Sedimentisphaerales bacterium]
MSELSRRGFLKASAGAVGASVAASRVHAASETPKVRRSAAKIFTVFGQTNPSGDDTSVVATSDADLLARLQENCPGIEFVARDLKKAGALESILNEMRALKAQDYDGVLLFGAPRHYGLTETGLPTLLVYSIHDFMNIPYTLFTERGKILTTTIDRWHFCASGEVSAKMERDLFAKVRLISALGRMKADRILVCTDDRFVDVYHGCMTKSHPPGYNELYQKTLAELLGTKLTKIGLDEVASEPEIDRLWHGDSGEANKIARTWIREAAAMVNTTESEVVRSAKVYLAMKFLMEKYDATAIAFHLRALVKNPKPEDRIWPSMGNSELQKAGQVGCCQAHIDVVLTHMLAQHAFGRPSMMGDYMLDTYNNVSYMMHCGGPWNPYGDDRRIPYVIMDHRERAVRAHSQPGVGACTSVLYPPNEPGTIWRIDIMTKDVLVHTGITIANPTAQAMGLTTVSSPYKPHWNETMCRTKFAIKVKDAKKIERYVYPDKYGVHRSGTLGDYREGVKDLAALIGLRVIEEDA